MCQKQSVVRVCNVIKYGCINYSQDTNWKIQASKDSLDQNHSHSCEDQTKCLLNPCLIKIFAWYSVNTCLNQNYMNGKTTYCVASFKPKEQENIIQDQI